MMRAKSEHAVPFGDPDLVLDFDLSGIGDLSGIDDLSGVGDSSGVFGMGS